MQPAKSFATSGGADADDRQHGRGVMAAAPQWSLARIKLRPALFDRRIVVLVHVAGVQLVGLFGDRLAGVVLFARPAGGLKSGSAERPEQLDQMRAAVDAAQDFERFSAPAGAA